MFKEGAGFNLYYFDDENESITISDECDYQSFLIFQAQQDVKIPKIFAWREDEDPLSYEQAFGDLNRTMTVSYIGDSEYWDFPRQMSEKVFSYPVPE